MNDNVIISIISKTYFIIISFLAFIFLLLTSIFIILQNGLFLENVSMSKFQAKKVYIKWDKKIDVSINELLINTTKNSQSKSLSTQEIKSYIQTLWETVYWFNSITVKNIQLDDMKASLIYKNDKKGSLVLKSNDLNIDTSIWIQSNILKIDINTFKELKNNIDTTGILFFNLDTVDLYTQLDVNINNDANLTIYSAIDTQKLDYRVVSNRGITNTKDILEMLNLPKEIHYWTIDAVEMSSLNISDIHGFIDFSKPESAVKNVYVQATVDKLNYAYNPKLDAVHTDTTELEFKNGVLYIRPKQAHSYGMFLDRSWLKIDFAQKEELLSLYLLFDGVADKNLLNILNTYKIKLPFEQKKGLITTDLNIIVNLRTIQVDAKGNFYTKKANFDYLGLNLDVYDAYISLDNYDAQIKSMRASYKDIANATVKMQYNAKQNSGVIDFKVEKIQLNSLALDTSDAPLDIQYRIAPDQDTISVESSKWKHLSKTLSVDALEIPFDIHTFNLVIPTTFIRYDDIGSAFISGSANVKNLKADITADILNFSYSGATLSQSNTPLQIQFDKGLSIISKDPIFFDVSGTNYKVEKLDVDIDAEDIYLKNTSLIISKYLSTKLYVKYNKKSKKAHVSLSNLNIKNYDNNQTLYKKKKILLSVELKKDVIKAQSSELDATFVSDNTGWELSLNSLNRISQKSPPLQKLHVNNGDLVLYKKNSDKFTQFSANLIYPYKILTKDKQPTDKYQVSGKIKKDKIYVRVNNQANVKIDSSVKIDVRNAGINVSEVLRLIQDTNDTQNESNQKITLNAKDSYLYLSDERRIVFDNIDLQYNNKNLAAQLQHGDGKAGLRIEKNQLNVYGQNFNDIFMENLFANSKFKGGKLDFSVSGTLDECKGLLHIKNSTIVKYALLNNVLAFINTVPSLVTFSLPGYSKNGLFVTQAYTSFHFTKGLFDLTDIYLDSKELDIVGKGIANINNNTVDITLNLITDLGSDLSQVPVVGYLIFDKDSISTTLEITGDLSDPSVKSLLAKEIVVAPLNIIKRTLTLPIKLLESINIESNNSN